MRGKIAMILIIIILCIFLAAAVCVVVGFAFRSIQYAGNTKRYGIGIELNADYFRDGVGYLKAADDDVETPTLFDYLDMIG